ncbi:MAG TPA: glycosyltransferase family 2 protein [Candidatus Nanoarchaeia archaeon]|nr:glycosyltransferase family 2 protein [Candidatus Nanoarchaeia archaeon]
MTFVDIVFFAYTFIGLYMLSLFLFLYIPNRHRLFDYPKGKPEPVSIIMPCFNAEKSIGNAIEHLIQLNYPKNMFEIIVVDDKSQDNSAKVVREYMKKYSNVRLIVNKRNSGGAAEPTNLGIKAAKYKYIAVADDDSFPEKDALLKMIGFLQENEKVGGVTCAVLAQHPNVFIQKLQAIEYTIIAFNRKLFDLIDSVYVTPGPFALYRKKTLVEIGLFDTNNLTQDIEIVWRMISQGYVARMCLATHVKSDTPNNFKTWFKQRVRWNIGGLQTLIKHKHYVFRKGMLGAFIIPFFSMSLFIGLFGLGLFLYLLSRKLTVAYLSTKYSVYASSAIINFSTLSFTPSVLNFFGIVLFILSTGFTLYGLSIMDQKALRNDNLFNVGFYLIIYLAIYPTIMITGLYKYWRKTYSWSTRTI